MNLLPMNLAPPIPLRAARGLSAPLPRALGRAVARARPLVVALLHRREVMRLLAWDSRQLKDVGLTRADVVGALQVPLGQDPSRVLAAARGGPDA